MKRIIIIFLVSIFISFTVTAQKTYVPDDNFEQALIDLAYDDVLDDYVTTANIENLILLNVSNKNIDDLTGIEDFIALSDFYCANNNLTSIDVSNTINLEILDCSSNQLAGLDVNTNVDLGVLYCNDNQIIALNLSQNIIIEEVDCFNNQLIDLDLRNGNNAIISAYNSTNNPDLRCIFVDNVQLSTELWTDVDATSTFVATQAQCDAIQVTYVPDDNFEQYLIDQSLDDVLDDYVLTANIKNRTYLLLDNTGVADLTGVEDFTALTSLECRYNLLTSLDLSANINLTQLYAGSNQISNINLSQTTALEILHVENNQLTSIDVSNNINLEGLFCTENQITSIDLSQNIALNKIFIYDNQLTNLSLIQNPALIEVNCNNNQLSNLDIRNANNTNIAYFNAENNINLTCIFVDDVGYSSINWTNVDLSSNFVATQDECNDILSQQTYVPDDNFEQALIDLGYDNVLNDYVYTPNIENVTSLSVGERDIADLTGIADFTALETLLCDINILTNLDVSNNINLTILACQNNQIKSLDVSTNFSLTNLTCQDNQLSNLDVRNANNSNFTVFKAANNPALTCIFVDDVAYSTVNWTLVDATSTFVETQAECDAIRTFVPDDNFEQALIDLAYDVGALDNYVITANIENITSLDIAGKNIIDLTGIEGFTALEILNCQDNQLSSLDISANSSLTHLFCYSNQLLNLDVSTNTGIVQLHSYSNQLSSLDVSTNTNLTHLFCYSNQLPSLVLNDNSNLIQLYCQDNQLTNLDVRNNNNINLTQFHANNNPDLTCIFVDDVAYSIANWTDIDATSTFVATETECDALDIDDLVNNSFKIYPNPVKNIFTIKTEYNITAIEIYDVLGKLVKTVTGNNTVIISNLQAGVYFVRIYTSNGIGVHKIIKK